MIHALNTEIAKKYGIGEALILHRMVYYLEKNIANNKHFYNNNYWIYNSVKAWQELFPYLTTDKLRTIFKNLKEKGAIITGNYNKFSYDRTTWYAIVDFNIFEIYGINIKKAIYNAAKDDNFIPQDIKNTHDKSLKPIWENSQMETGHTPNEIRGISQMRFGEIPEPIPEESIVVTKESGEDAPPTAVKKSTYEEIKGESIDFEAGVVSWYAKLTGRPINDIRQIPDFKTPENRSILEKAFANRKTDWRVAIEKAGERSLSSNPSYRWKDFLQTLYVRLAEDEETETAFEIPDNYKNCIEYYIQDCDWDTDKFLSACKCLLARVDKKHFTNTQLDDLARAFENREAHAGYALMFAYDRALYKRDYFNLNFFDKILTYLRDTGDIVPRSPKNEGIIRVKYNIIFDNYQSDTPKEIKLELKRKREAADGMRYTELGTVDLPAKPKIEKVEEIEEVEESEPIEKTMAYINDIKKKLGNSWNFNA